MGRGTSLFIAALVVSGCSSVEVIAEQDTVTEDGLGVGIFVPPSGVYADTYVHIRSFEPDSCTLANDGNFDQLQSAPDGFQWVLSLNVRPDDPVGVSLPFYEGAYDEHDARLFSVHAHGRYAEGTNWEYKVDRQLDGCDGGEASFVILERTSERILIEFENVCVFDEGTSGDEHIPSRLERQFELSSCERYVDVCENSGESCPSPP